MDAPLPPVPYSPDRSLPAKVRRRLLRLCARRPARGTLERPLLTVTFDDVPESACRAGARLLEERGLRGTFYVSPGLAGTTGAMGRYAGPAEWQRLAAAGHELGCHTFSHLDCAQATPAQLVDEVERSRAALVAAGVPAPATFAWPYGELSLAAKRALSGRFQLLRAVHPGLLGPGSDLNQAPAVSLSGSVAQARALALLERAAAGRSWLVVFTHDVAPAPSPWGCSEAALAGLLDRAARLGVEVVTAAAGARLLGG